MDRDALIGELKALPRGRGVRRPDVLAWLGPELRHVIGWRPEMTDEDARAALVAAIDRALAGFPQDLDLLYRVATAIASDEPFLEARLDALDDEVIQRGPRALRRRLRQAEQLVADALLQEHGIRDSDTGARGWQWINQDLHLVLGVGAQLDLRRRLLALDSHQKFVSESFFVPDIQDGDTVDIEVLSGAELVGVDDSARGRWTLKLELPRELGQGQELDTHLRVSLSRAQALSPFLALAPVRSTRAASVRVDFGTPPVGKRPWLVDGVFSAALTIPDPRRIELDLDESNSVRRSFSNPRVGLVYGIGWHWVS